MRKEIIEELTQSFKNVVKDVLKKETIVIFRDEDGEYEICDTLTVEDIERIKSIKEDDE